MVTVNSTIVAAITWVVGLILKQVKWIENDRLPQILYMISVGATYLLEIVSSLGAKPAEAATAPPLPMDTVDPMMSGSTSWLLATVWDWIGRKMIFEKLFKKG